MSLIFIAVSLVLNNSDGRTMDTETHFSSCVVYCLSVLLTTFQGLKLAVICLDLNAV